MEYLVIKYYDTDDRPAHERRLDKAHLDMWIMRMKSHHNPNFQLIIS